MVTISTLRLISRKRLENGSRTTRKRLEEVLEKLHDSNLDSGALKARGHTAGDGAVGDDAVQLGRIGYVHEAALVEFRRIEHGNHLRRLLNHHLVQQRFLHAGRRDTVLDGERVHAEKELVSAEIAQHRMSEWPYGRVAVDAYVAAQQHYVEALIDH